MMEGEGVAVSDASKESEWKREKKRQTQPVETEGERRKNG